MKKQYKSGKPHGSLYTGGNAGRGQNTPRKQAPTAKHITKAIPLAIDRYQSAKDPLRRAMGVHGSTKVSPMMAQKFVTHPDSKVANQAKKIAKGYTSSIGGNAE